MKPNTLKPGSSLVISTLLPAQGIVEMSIQPKKKKNESKLEQLGMKFIVNTF